MEATLKILFIEDVKLDAELNWREIEKNGIVFNKLLVENRKDFLAGLESFKPDIIISDYSMPQFTGMQALTLRNEMCPLTPFILVTGSNNETVAVDCMKAGADDYVLKDNLSRLVPAIKNALNKINLLSEKKRSEEALRESEAKYSLVIKNIGEGIGILDTEEKFVFANPAADTIFGVGPGKLEGMNILRFLSPKGIEIIRKQTDNRRNKITSFYEVEIILENGNKKQLSVTGTPKLDENGNFSGTFGIFRDISERKKAERTLHDIIENNPMSIQILDTEGFTLKVNQAFIKLFGSVPPPDYSMLSDIQLKEKGFAELLERIMNGEVVQFPDMVFNPHDSIPEMPDCLSWINAIGFSLVGGDGKPEKIVLMHENITERKLVERQLIIAKDHAEESDRLKTAFLANMSHEIRTPMNGILGFSELLKEPGLTGEQQQEYIRIIEKSGARMLNIINDIIDISKIEAGLMEVDIKDTNINEKLEFIYNFFKPQVEDKGLQLLFKNTLPTKEATIRTDKEKVYSILTNLVKNAIIYSKEGAIDFGYIKKGETLEFYVKDTGLGIPKDRQSAIFERFIQADMTGKMARQGAGLGLSISKAYVEMLGGKIWVESEVGIGSTFYFTLPYNAGRIS